MSDAEGGGASLAAPEPWPRVGRVLLVVLAVIASALLGAATSLAAVAVHARWWGLLLGLAATTAAALALPARGGARLGFVAGWVGFLGYLLTPRDEGDYLVSQDLEGYLLLVFAVVLAVLAVATLPARRARARAPGSRRGSGNGADSSLG